MPEGTDCVILRGENNQRPVRMEEDAVRFAYLIMGQFHAAVDQAEICNDQDWAQLAGAANLEEAVEAARCLQREGVECIELCGAFGEAGARKIIEATGNRIPIGFVTHLPEQEAVYRAAFPEGGPGDG